MQEIQRIRAHLQAQMALLIRRSSVRARRGPPEVFAATFALLTGLRSESYPPELPRGACRVDGESGIPNPQVVDSSPTRPTIGLCRSQACEPFASACGASRRTPQSATSPHEPSARAARAGCAALVHV